MLPRLFPLVLLACGAAPSPVAPAPAGRMGVHGMVLFGGGRAYVTHIPMAHAPHDVDFVAEVTLTRVAHAGGFADRGYTLRPGVFSLDALRGGAMTRFTATLYEGNFEDGGRALAPDVEVRVGRVLRNTVLTGGAEATALDYLAVGARNDAALVHTIEGTPSYQQVLAARFGEDGPSDAALTAGAPLRIEGRGGKVGDRLRPGVARATWKGGRVAEVTVVRELACLVGPTFETACP